MGSVVDPDVFSHQDLCRKPIEAVVQISIPIEDLAIESYDAVGLPDDVLDPYHVVVHEEPHSRKNWNLKWRGVFIIAELGHSFKSQDWSSSDVGDVAVVIGSSILIEFDHVLEDLVGDVRLEL